VERWTFRRWRAVRLLHPATDMVTQFVPTAAGGLEAATNEELVVASDGSEDLDTGDICMLVGGSTGELTGVAYTAMFERLV